MKKNYPVSNGINNKRMNAGGRPAAGFFSRQNPAQAAVGSDQRQSRSAFGSPKMRFFSTGISLWIVSIFVVIAFAGGVLAGGGVDFNPASAGGGKIINDAKASDQIIIKGLDATTTASSTATTTMADFPDYLKKDINFKQFWEVWNIVKEKYYNKDIPDTQLFYGALQGILSSLGDPYSVFMTPTDSNQFQDNLKGNFEGIGAEIAVKNNNLIIVAPLPDTPAEKAGLKPKDLIVKINGTSTKNMSSNDAVNLIRGPKGTKVTLTIFREGMDAPKDFEIVRDTITVKSVTWEIKDKDIAYIRMRQFNEDTVPLFDKAIEEITANKSLKYIILDLRNDPGGYLQSAIDVGGEWVGNEVVVSEKLRDGEEIKHTSDQFPRLAGYKTVVLVDGGSASASEIVSGALQDWGKAKLVGAKTFGKGSVQDLVNLEDGSSVKITIAKWYTPKGRSIDEQGIEPDVKVEMTAEDFNKDKDPQLDKAIEIIRQ